MQSKVVQGRDISKEFAVTNGVNQECILAPTLFLLYLAAMLQVAVEDLDEGIYIQSMGLISSTYITSRQNHVLQNT